MKKYVLLLFTAVLVLSACTSPMKAEASTLPVATSTTAALSAKPATVEPSTTSTSATVEAAPEALASSVDTDPAPANVGSNPITDQADPSPALAAAAADELGAAEIEGILYMREEEKLAHDVYTALYEAWGVPVFRNIASSEATHLQAVQTLIERYRLDDPAAGNDAGVFENETLQELYDSLMADGSQSLESALRVGAAIEEIDILDLEEHLANTDRADIILVYQNLTKGSRNHLRAFVTNLDRQTGVTYQPQYLSQDAYEAIVNAGTERGRSN